MEVKPSFLFGLLPSFLFLPFFGRPGQHAGADVESLVIRKHLEHFEFVFLLHLLEVVFRLVPLVCLGKHVNLKLVGPLFLLNHGNKEFGVVAVVLAVVRIVVYRIMLDPFPMLGISPVVVFESCLLTALVVVPAVILTSVPPSELA